MTGPGQRNPVRSAALVVGCLGLLGLAVVNAALRIPDPVASDFTGFYSVLHAYSAHLGCVYSRPVQFAGAAMVPQEAWSVHHHVLAWHFNEPMLLTMLAYPLTHLPLVPAGGIWVGGNAAALVGCGALLWRRRGSLPPLLTAAVITALLCNEIVNTNFWLAQDDAILLLVFLGGLSLLGSGHDVSAGLLLGVVALKPQLVYLALAVLVFQRRWRAVAGLCGSGAVLWAASVAMVGTACTATWLHTASLVGELQVGMGIPSSLARLTGTKLPAEALFAVLSLAALALLWWLRHLDTDLAVCLAVGIALAIGLHVLTYDMLFLAPLGIRVARRYPWAVFAAGWLFTAAQVVDASTSWAGSYKTPVRLAEAAPVLAVGAAIAVVRRLEDPGQQGRGAAPVLAVARQRRQQDLFLPDRPVPLQSAHGQPEQGRQHAVGGEGQAEGGEDLP
jgi:hypothetical protein